MGRLFKIKKLSWIPFIYSYWAMEVLIATWAFIQLILTKEKTWKSTEKHGIVTNLNAIKNQCAHMQSKNSRGQ